MRTYQKPSSMVSLAACSACLYVYTSTSQNGNGGYGTHSNRPVPPDHLPKCAW